MNGGWAPRLRSAAGGSAGVTATALVLTLVMAAPVLVDPDTRLFGREISGRHHDPFTVIEQFESPRPLGLYTQPVTDWAGAATARVLGNGVRAYHLVVLASFPLAALFAFLLARRLTGSAAAAWPAALAYAFLPFHWAHAAYHPHGAQTQWLPLYLLALWSCAERFTARRAAGLIAAAALVALSNFYFGLIAAVLTPAALGTQWWVAARSGRPRPHRAPAATAAVLLALAGGGLAYVARWAPMVLENPTRLAFPAEDVGRYTARWWSYLMPPVDHPLGGARLSDFWSRQDPGGLVERQLALGIGLLALAALGLMAWWKGDRPRLTRSVPVLAAVAGVAYVFSLAPVWRLGSFTWAAPSGLLYSLAPMFRAHARFGLAVGLATAILAGIGFAWLWAGSGRRPRLLAGGLVAVLTLELTPFPPWRWRDVLPTSAHRWLAVHKPEAEVLDCVGPGEPAQRSVDRFFPGRLTRLPPPADCRDPQTASRFAAAGLSHLLVRRAGDLGRWLADRPAPPGLETVGEFDDALLFRLTAPAATHLATIGGGFHRREYKGDSSYRWMTATGHLDLVVSTPRSSAMAAMALELDLHAFPEPRAIEVRIDGRPVAVLQVPIEKTSFRVDLGALGPGRHRLELASRSPATVPDELLANGDHRRLAIALWGWRWVELDG